MTKTAAVGYEVRWRKNADPANQWSTPVAVGADGHVKVPGLERVTDYTFEARAISGCGAKSAWATQTLALPDAPTGTLTLTDIASEVTSAQNSADNANNQLAQIADDSLLSPPEKPTVERDYSVITTEQAGIDAQATAYGITTEKTAYDSAVSALTAYLAALTAPVAWNDKSGYTNIVGTTFRAKFNTVYTARQTLLNAIYAAAKAKADAAQSTANTASDTANTALANGDQATIINPQFNGWGANGSLHGWTSDQGTWVHQSGTNGPLSGTSSYAFRTGSATSSDAIRNAGRFPVYPGAVIKASCLIRGTGSPNGSCQVRVSWRDASDSELSVTHGSAVTGNVTATSSVSATAPAGAVIAHIEADANGHTTGAYAVDNFTASSTADSMDQVPDSATRFAAAEAGADKTAGKPLSSLSGRTADKLSYTAGGTVDSLRPSEVGAEKTTGKSITVLTGRTLDNIGDSSARFAAIHDPTTQAQQAAQIAASYQPGQNVIRNPSFAIATPGGGYPGWSVNGPGWSAGNKGLFGNVYFDTCAECVVSSATPVTSVLYGEEVPFPPNATHSVRITYAVDRSYSTGIATADIQYFDAAGNTLLDGPQVFGVATTNGITTGQIEGAVSPAGTAYIAVRLFVQSAAETAGPVYFRIGSVKVELGDHCTPFSDDATQFGNQLTNPGSGQQIGDQRNLVSSITRNSGLVRSATALTATSAGAVNVNAHTITLGAASIGYNAVTNAVTGLSVGSGYYVYTRDNYAGGTQTWAANGNATVVNGFDDAYNAGYVTIPSSGSSGGGGAGGGGGGSCVCAAMYLRAGLTARDIAVRWRWWKPWLWFLRGREGWHLIRRRPRIVQEICMRLTVADGSTIDCSVSTPITTQSGESVQAPMAYGRMIWTDSGWQRVIECESLRGERDVVRICVGGHSFLAGANPFHRIDTHNVWKP